MYVCSFLFRNINKFRFSEAIAETVNLSDKLGYVYWFAVLVTITCGGATGIFTTLKNKHDMTIICRQKHEFYETYWSNAEADIAAVATTTAIMPNDENLSFVVSTMANAKWNNGTYDRSSGSSPTGVDAKRRNNNDGFVGINELVARVNHFDRMFE